MKKILILSFILLFAMCRQDRERENKNSIFESYTNKERIDAHSFAKPYEAITTHLDLTLNVNFTSKTLKGTAVYDIASNNASKIILDTRDLNIINTKVNGIEVNFEFGKKDDLLGTALIIPLSKDAKQISIEYGTSPKSAALQWLDPIQTADKKAPFLFSQGQAILTRTWIPCQDSPGIRITYDAHVTVPKSLLAIMSAKNPKSKSMDGQYDFEMQQAIPPYLIALAVGDLSFGEIGQRTGVYAEPSVLKDAVYEFGDMEKMLTTAEQLYGPYLWDQYDVVVLPPSFPFGGMENPRLTFATPTILAGDRSLTALIAHELAHSWSGNLVTNATWDDFWLNEGFTVYFERRIMEALYGLEYANMLAMLGFQDLESEIQHLGHNHTDTHLKLDLRGRDADDGMTDIAYEKGAYFLLTLESKIGRDKFDTFLKEYFEHHKFKTISTKEFIQYLNKNLIEKYHVNINIAEWIFGPGIPKNCPKIYSDKFNLIDTIILTEIPNLTVDKSNKSNWSTHEWLHFIRHLPNSLTNKYMSQMDEKYNFTNTGNSEIKAAWFELSIRNGYYEEIKETIEVFLVNVGRRKFLTPLYSALKEKGDIALAKKIYKNARSNYHSVSKQTIDQLLEY